MKCESGKITLGQAILVVALLAIVAILILPMLTVKRHTNSLQYDCRTNLEHVAQAFFAYYSTYNDYFPYFISPDAGMPWTETRTIQPFKGTFVGKLKQYSEDPREQCPTDSLSLLYPDFAPKLSIFACRGAPDTPRVYCKEYKDATRANDGEREKGGVTRLWSVFGDERLTPASKGARLGTAATNPFGRANKSPFWSSYGYDHRVDMRKAGANHVIVADMDESVFSRSSETANHSYDATVLLLDGHVRQTRTAYASDNPLDNIFRAEGGDWDPETDSYIDRP
jgi:hypothetical protein